MRLPTVLGLVLFAAVVSGCAEVTTRVVSFNPAARYPPTQNVEILLEPPKRPYVQIAALEAEGNFGTSELEVLEKLRERGRELGADAIVRTESRQWYQPPTAMYDPMYDPFFYPRRWGYYPYWPPYGGYQLVGGGYYYTAKANAIKYQPVAGESPAAAGPPSAPPQPKPSAPK